MLVKVGAERVAVALALIAQGWGVYVLIKAFSQGVPQGVLERYTGGLGIAIVVIGMLILLVDLLALFIYINEEETMFSEFILMKGSLLTEMFLLQTFVLFLSLMLIVFPIRCIQSLTGPPALSQKQMDEMVADMKQARES